MTADKTRAAAVIPLSELRRIQDDLLPTTEKSDPRKERQVRLHELSNEKKKSWTNTLEGSRAANLAKRQQRLEKEELARQKQDLAEARIQLENRRKVISRANHLLQDESDRMKSFHSKMQLSDCLAEREAQIHIKDELQRLEQIREERFLENEKHNYRKMLERELREKIDQQGKMEDTVKVMGQQLHEAKMKRIRDIEDDIMEGELLRQKAVEDAEEQRKAIIKRKAEATRALVDTQKSNAYLRTVKEEDAKRKHREARKINEYADFKEKQMALRKAKAAEIQTNKQMIRQRLIDTQAAQLAEMQGNEEALMEQQVLDKAVKDEKARLAKEARLQKMQDEVNKSRQSQIDRKNAQRMVEKKEEAEMSQFWSEWCKHLDLQEKEEKDLSFQAAKNLQDEHRRQIAYKERQKKLLKDTETLVVERAQQAIDVDSLEYYKYAESMIREYAEDGKNVLPLIKELKEYRKKQQS